MLNQVTELQRYNDAIEKLMSASAQIEALDYYLERNPRDVKLQQARHTQRMLEYHALEQISLYESMRARV